MGFLDPKPPTRTELNATILDQVSGVAVSKSDAQMINLGVIDRQRSSGQARIAFEDAASFIESWADLTAWSNPAVGTVSGGFMTSTVAGGADKYHVHDFPVAAGESARVLFNFRLGTGNGDVILGFTSGTQAGTEGIGASKGVMIKPDGRVMIYDLGVAGAVLATLPAKDYLFTLIADADYISMSVRAADGSYGEYRTRFARAGYTINGIMVYQACTTGHLIGKIGARKAITTVNPRAGVEDKAITMHWSGNGTSNYKMQVPKNYDARKPMPLAICFHGNGSTENINMADGNAYSLFGSLSAAGYLVLTAAYSTFPSSWGAQGSLDAYYAAYKWARDNYNIGPVVFHGNSMGGIESLLALAENRIPGVVAWAGSNPTVNLAACYAEGNISFASTIRNAYGIAADGSDYAAKTAGHDPALMAGSAFRSVPMKIWAATDDITVLKTNNTDILAAKVAPYAPVTVVPVTGGHGAAAAFPGSDIVAFFNKYVAG